MAQAVKNLLQCKRHRRLGFDPCVGKIPWKRKWQLTPVFLPGKSMDRGAWWAIVHRATKSWIWLSMHTWWALRLIMKLAEPTACLVICRYSEYKGYSFCSGSVQFSSVQSLSRVRRFVTPWIATLQASLSITNSRSSLKLMSIESVMPSSHLILCRPLLLLPPIPPSIRVFSNESTLSMRWPKYWSFSFSIIPSKELQGLISFRMYWLDLLAVQGTLKSLLQHHSSKTSILPHSAFFTVQLSHPYMTTGKTVALTRRTFVGKVMSLLLNMLSKVGHNFPSKE